MNNPKAVAYLQQLTTAKIQAFTRDQVIMNLGILFYLSPLERQQFQQQLRLLEERRDLLTEKKSHVVTQNTTNVRTIKQLFPTLNSKKIVENAATQKKTEQANSSTHSFLQLFSALSQMCQLFLKPNYNKPQMKIHSQLWMLSDSQYQSFLQFGGQAENINCSIYTTEQKKKRE